MRTLPYAFGKTNPSNKDDCLDYMESHNLSSVSLDLEKRPEFYEQGEFMRLRGRFTWEFEKIQVNYTENYGGCFSHESQKRQQKSIDNANRRLEDDLKLIESKSVKIIGREKRFEL